MYKKRVTSAFSSTFAPGAGSWLLPAPIFLIKRLPRKSRPQFGFCRLNFLKKQPHRTQTASFKTNGKIVITDRKTAQPIGCAV